MPTPSEGRSAAYKRRWRFFGGRFKGFGLGFSTQADESDDAPSNTASADPYACTCGPKSNGWNPSCPTHFARR